MEAYLIHLRSLPSVRFALTVDLAVYRNYFDHIPDYLEISVIEQGEIVSVSEDGEYVVESKSVSVITSQDRMRTYSPGRQKHTTVGVHVAYDCEKIQCDALTPDQVEALYLRLLHEDTFLFPIAYPLGSEYERVLQRIRAIARNVLHVTAGDRQQAIANWFHLASELTAMALRELDERRKNVSPSADRYVDRTVQYIKENLRGQLRISDLAAVMRLSPGYLQNIFKSVYGRPIISYWREMQMKAAADYLRTFGGTTSSIAEYVGIDDTAYFCRMFKKYNHATVSEYRKRLLITDGEDVFSESRGDYKALSAENHRKFNQKEK